MKPAGGEKLSHSVLDASPRWPRRPGACGPLPRPRRGPSPGSGSRGWRQPRCRRTGPPRRRTPRARAASIIASALPLVPQRLGLSIFRWEISTGHPADSPTAIVSARDFSISVPSLRMWEAYSPPAAAGHPGQLGDLGRIGPAPRHVLEPGREPDGALLHRLGRPAPSSSPSRSGVGARRSSPITSSRTVLCPIRVA